MLCKRALMTDCTAKHSPRRGHFKHYNIVTVVGGKKTIQHLIMQYHVFLWQVSNRNSHLNPLLILGQGCKVPQDYENVAL